MHVIFYESNDLYGERKLDDDDVVGLKPSLNEPSVNEKTNGEKDTQLQ